MADFERAVAGSKAVMARPLREVDRLAASDQELVSTFYKMLAADVRLPHGNEWDYWRRVADEALFPGYKEEIRFAALSLDGAGLPSYGECSLVLREEMIAHRASVFEENSTVFLKSHGFELPPGRRATWADRAKLCVAKLAGQVTSDTAPEQLRSLLLSSGPTSGSDRFIEVNIWGSLSMLSVERVLLPAARKRRHAFRKELRDRLRGLGVALQEAS